MLRKTEKKMKQKQKPKPKPKSDKHDPSYCCYILHTSKITCSSHCVIKSWRLPNRQCATASSARATLVELHGKLHTTRNWDAQLVYKCSAEKPRYSYPSPYFRASMLVTGECTPAFAFSITRGSNPVQLTTQNCDIRERYDPTQNMRFFNVVEFKGRFYAMSLQGSVVVIEDEAADSDRFGITRIGGNRAVPSMACKHFREYLVESGGNIFVVFLVSTKSVDVVDDVEVFRLDTEKLLWVKAVRNIGNRALFLDDEEYRVSFEGSEMGFEKNLVYFTHPGIQDWLVYDMETRCILPALELKFE